MKNTKRIEELNNLVRQLSDEKIRLEISYDYIDDYGDEASYIILDEEVTFAQAFYIKLVEIFENFKVSYFDSYLWKYLDIYFRLRLNEEGSGKVDDYFYVYDKKLSLEENQKIFRKTFNI